MSCLLVSYLFVHLSPLYWVGLRPSLIRNTPGSLFESIISTYIQSLAFKGASDGPGLHRVNITSINGVKLG
jgi:hypothetical protein